jgi:hypothetical protein
MPTVHKWDSLWPKGTTMKLNLFYQELCCLFNSVFRIHLDFLNSATEQLTPL